MSAPPSADTVQQRRLPSDMAVLLSMRDRLHSVIQMRGGPRMEGREGISVTELKEEIQQLLERAKSLVTTDGTRPSPSGPQCCAARRRLQQALSQNAR